MISMNRNTSPISPLTKEDIYSAIEKTELHLYPDDEHQTFKELYGAQYNLSPQNMELANGSDEWIQKIIMTLGQNGIMSVQPDFNMYQAYAAQSGIRYDSVTLADDYSFDQDKIISEIKDKKPSVFFISNPHNPTGVLLPEDFIDELAEIMKDIGGYLVLDEAYVEFSRDHRRPVGEHIIIIRTMSKLYGLAGLRVGIAIAEGKTFGAITRINHPYPVNSLSLNLGSALLRHQDALKSWFDYQKTSKHELEHAFKYAQKYVSIKPSDTNFIFTYGTDAIALGNYLKDNGYHGRLYDETYLNDAVRYSIIGLDDYEQLIQLIKKWSESI